MNYTMNTCTNCWGSFLENYKIEKCPLCNSRDIIVQSDYEINENNIVIENKDEFNELSV